MPHHAGDVIWAPIPILLREVFPVVLERGRPGYAATPLAHGERRLNDSEVTGVLLASAYVGVLVSLWEQPLYRYSDFGEDRSPGPVAADIQGDIAFEAGAQLRRSVYRLRFVSDADRAVAVGLMDSFEHSKVVREETPLGRCLIEDFWPLLQAGEPNVRSAMWTLIAHGLECRGMQSKMRTIFDDRAGM